MPIDLDELERLAKAATPGPWVANNWGRVWRINAPDSKQLVCDTMRNTVRNPRKWRGNARLIAAMREALPELIAELKANRAEKAAFTSWQTGTPPGPGFYWVKYKSGYVKVTELEWRRAGLGNGVSWVYLGIANEYYQPFEEEENIAAWAGPIPMPEAKEAGE